MTQQQIIQGILEGREFFIGSNKTPYRLDGSVIVNAISTNSAGFIDGYVLGMLKQGKITLAPQLPEPLSDEMGELLWKWLNHLGVRATYDIGSLISVGLLDSLGITPKGEYLLGQWLMEKNKEAVNV